MRNGIVAMALFVCGACGGGSASSSASVTGTLGGAPMDAQDAVSNVFTSGSNSEGAILITNAPSTCAKLAANQQPKNAKAIQVAIGTQTGSAYFAPAASGAYPVYSAAASASVTGNVALALYVSTDASCNPVATVGATSGTVTLTRVDSGGYSGTFDITFSDASHITGSFTANRCTALSPTPGGTCV
jgi:hypothetical protein